MIIVERQKYDIEHPKWVYKCPLCTGNAEFVIKLKSSFFPEIRIVVCDECREELIEKLQQYDKNPSGDNTTS